MDTEGISWFPELPVLSESQMLILARRIIAWHYVAGRRWLFWTKYRWERRKDLYLLNISCG